MDHWQTVKTILRATVDYNVILVTLRQEAEVREDYKEVARLNAMRDGSSEALYHILTALNEKEATCRTVSVTPVKNPPTG